LGNEVLFKKKQLIFFFYSGLILGLFFWRANLILGLFWAYFFGGQTLFQAYSRLILEKKIS
jgi:ABC-type lipoprotein release transport system permease subunit